LLIFLLSKEIFYKNSRVKDFFMQRRTSNIKKIIPGIALMVCFGFSSMVYGEFYKYTDDTGKIFFVDDAGKIPEVYRQQIKVYKEKYDDLSETQRQALMENERQKQFTDVMIMENKVLIPVRLGLNGREIEVRLLLDTGASIVTLHDDAARRLGFENVQQAKARVAGGKEVTFDLAAVDFLSVGPYEQTDVLVGILNFQGQDMGYDGLLGMNFLQYFSYDIDFIKQRIKWTPKSE
jgi:hypothetical protein